MATKRKTKHETPTQRDSEQSSHATAAGQPESEGQAPPAGDTDTPVAESPPAGDADSPLAEAPADAEQRADELASRLEEANKRLMRLAADFDNLKKRSRQEQLDTMRYAAAAVAERLLPVLDDTDRALSHAPEGIDETWLKGVRLTFQQLVGVLESVGVERIDAVGSAFDPAQHEAIGSEETSEHPEDTVVAELRPGYRMHDRVLRPALVKVARPPS